MRNKSGIFVAPDLWMSSCVITNAAAAVRDSFCSFLDTDVTSMFIKSSRLTVVRSPRTVAAGFCEAGGVGEACYEDCCEDCPPACPGNSHIHTARTPLDRRWNALDDALLPFGTVSPRKEMCMTSAEARTAMGS
jgi:hypothetical protein